MANKLNSLAHTKWLCKYHIVFTLKYRRKIIYYQYRKDLIEIIKLLCQYKGVKIIEGHMMLDHVHLLVSMKCLTIVRQSLAIVRHFTRRSFFYSILVTKTLRDLLNFNHCTKLCFVLYCL